MWYITLVDFSYVKPSLHFRTNPTRLGVVKSFKYADEFHLLVTLFFAVVVVSLFCLLLCYLDISYCSILIYLFDLIISLYILVVIIGTAKDTCNFLQSEWN